MKGSLPQGYVFALSLRALRLRSLSAHTMAGFAAALVGLSCGSAFAAVNPYADAPKGDWSYEAVEQLIKEDVITGYDAAVFSKDKTATRYEMARFLANGLSKYDSATPEQKAVLDHLAEDYKAELGILGIARDAAGAYGVKEPEKPAPAPAPDKGKLPKVRVGGETLVEVYNMANGKQGGGKNTNNWRQRIHLDADVNDRVFYHARIQGQGQFGSNGNQSDSEKFRFHQNYFGIKNFLGIERIHLGRLNLPPGRQLALAYQGNADGIWFRHGFGKARVEGFYVDTDRENNTPVELRGLNFNYAPTDKFEANVMYFNSDKTSTTDDSAHYGDIGFSAELDKGLTLVSEYTQSSASGSPKAWAAQLTYNWKSMKRQRGLYTYEGMVNVKKAHDQAVGISWRDIAPNSLPGGGNYYGFGDAVTKNQKGIMIGYQNMVMEGVRLSLNYQHLWPHEGSGKAANRYYAAFDLYY